jgi:hypothetical protein
MTISQGKTSFNGKSKSCGTDISNGKIQTELAVVVAGDIVVWFVKIRIRVEI